MGRLEKMTTLTVDRYGAFIAHDWLTSGHFRVDFDVHGTYHTASRCSQPLAAPKQTFHMTSILPLQIKLAFASGG